MPTPFDPAPFAAKFHVNPHGAFMRITGRDASGQLLGYPVRFDNTIIMHGRRFVPKQIAYILHHGHLPKFITHANGNPNDMRADNLIGTEIHPRWSLSRQSVPIDSCKPAPAPTADTDTDCGVSSPTPEQAFTDKDFDDI